MRRSNLDRRQVTIWRLRWQALCSDCQNVPLFASPQRQRQEGGMKSSIIVTSAVNKNSPLKATNQSLDCSVVTDQTRWGGGIDWASFFLCFSSRCKESYIPRKRMRVRGWGWKTNTQQSLKKPKQNKKQNKKKTPLSCVMHAVAF